MGFPSPSPNASRTLLPIHNNQYNQNLRQTTPPATSPSSLPVAEKSPTTANSSTKDKLASITTTLKSKFDTLLPPDKTYIFGLPRRRFLLFVILPISLLLLLVFILALGLGIGLHRPSSELPLPWNDTPGKEWKGDLTYYSPALGACGYNNTDADAVVAVAWSVYDAAAAEGNGNPNENPLCGRKIRVWITEGDEDGGVNVTVMDRCTGCEVTDLDLSPGVFGLLADEAEGRVKGRWRWLP
ncbi:RlpA-like double-psi beta-barrel-protein domain-containing protein-containing protein [Apodospora peruviana]|uniref:RlpA-like double-psi beta-barrel-protein domain-containing protein-containing protein n=1 Tax=Apodospora peruviana TaxID=516989 RepID=A0AAE0HZ86_9PEZI|nr:RlpA-like double-psi beta-barrel-protein domain-containing protein-containing protein [Apodospora peruviana]